jgi:hypothetical protein
VRPLIPPLSRRVTVTFFVVARAPFTRSFGRRD